MVEIVNLNRARKARDASQAKATAKINRVAHGRTRAQRDAAEAEQSHLTRLLDGAKREPSPED